MNVEAREPVIARPAGHEVAAGASVEDVVSLAAVEAVVAAVAVQPVGAAWLSGKVRGFVPKSRHL